MGRWIEDVDDQRGQLEEQSVSPENIVEAIPDEHEIGEWLAALGHGAMTKTGRS